MTIKAPAQISSKFVGNSKTMSIDFVPSALSRFPARLLFAVFIIFSFPAFTLQLAMDAQTGKWTGSPIMQTITISSELFIFAVILFSREIARFIFRCWPIWVLVSIAFISTAWSRNPAATIHEANTYMTSALLGLVIVGALPQFQCIRFVIRVMVLGCILSIAWVLIFPEIGIHQLTDAYQTVHAGLWRGVFSHKQGLGVFAGLTTGLLIFYRTAIFQMPLFVISLVCSITCLIGTQSATGIVVAIITPVFFYIGYFATRFSIAARRIIMLKIAFGLIAVFIFYKIGVFNFLIVHVLDKSTDLTGRGDFWPIILNNFYNSGSSLLGGGYGAKLAENLSEWSVDNGYIDKFIEFGYVSSPVIFGTFVLILWGGVRLVLTTPSNNAMTNVFPFAIWSIILIINITESNFMTKCMATVLTSIAVGLIIQCRTTLQRSLKSNESAPMPTLASPKRPELGSVPR